MPLYDRAYKVADGVVYDSRTADVVYHNDTLFGRTVLAVTPDGHYFEAIWRGLTFGWLVYPLGNQLWAIREAVGMKAPDSVLERLGVRILKKVKSDEPYNLISADMLWGERKLLAACGIFWRRTTTVASSCSGTWS